MLSDNQEGEDRGQYRSYRACQVDNWGDAMRNRVVRLVVLIRIWRSTEARAIVVSRRKKCDVSSVIQNVLA